MGCFDSTCAVTNLPIHYGDPIVYVEMKKSAYKANTHGLMAALHQINSMDKKDFIKRSQISMDIVRRIRTKAGQDISDDEHQKYILLDAIADMQKIKDEVFIYYGFYNDYGAVTDVEGSFEGLYPEQEVYLSDRYFFVHRGVWDHFDTGDDHKTLEAIVREMYKARKELVMGASSLGEQYSGQEFVNARQTFIEIEEKILCQLPCTNEEDYES